MDEPLKKCSRCGFHMHAAEYECVNCQLLDAREIALKKWIGGYFQGKHPHLRQRYTYLTDPHQLQGWAGGDRD